MTPISSAYCEAQTLKRKQSVMLLGCSAHRNISVNYITIIIDIQCVCVLCVCAYRCVCVSLCICRCVFVCVTLDKLDDVVENSKDSKEDGDS